MGSRSRDRERNDTGEDGVGDEDATMVFREESLRKLM